MPDSPKFLIVADMTYLITTNHAGDPETYRKICELVDGHTDGLVARYAGMNDRGLAVTAVWESKAHSDRFAAEHLVPALHSIVGPGDHGPSVVVDFETFEAYIPESAA
jgi:hypothetical protein